MAGAGTEPHAHRCRRQLRPAARGEASVRPLSAVQLLALRRLRGRRDGAGGRRARLLESGRQRVGLRSDLRLRCRRSRRRRRRRQRRVGGTHRGRRRGRRRARRDCVRGVPVTCAPRAAWIRPRLPKCSSRRRRPSCHLRWYLVDLCQDANELVHDTANGNRYAAESVLLG